MQQHPGMEQGCEAGHLVVQVVEALGCGLLLGRQQSHLLVQVITHVCALPPPVAPFGFHLLHVCPVCVCVHHTLARHVLHTHTW